MNTPSLPEAEVQYDDASDADETRLATSSTGRTRLMWDQLPEEPYDAYANFLMYRNLGPGRTMEATLAVALKGVEAGEMGRNGVKPKVRNGLTVSSFTKQSAHWKWRERASAWDVYMLQALVPETASIIYQSVKEFGLLILRMIMSGEIKPTTWSELKEAVVVLSQFISPDVVAKAVDQFATVEPDYGQEGFLDNGGSVADDSST